jgi:hypothetical protein
MNFNSYLAHLTSSFTYVPTVEIEKTKVNAFWLQPERDERDTYLSITPDASSLILLRSNSEACIVQLDEKELSLENTKFVKSFIQAVTGVEPTGQLKVKMIQAKNYEFGLDSDCQEDGGEDLVYLIAFAKQVASNKQEIFGSLEHLPENYNELSFDLDLDPSSVEELKTQIRDLLYFLYDFDYFENYQQILLQRNSVGDDSEDQNLYTILEEDEDKESKCNRGSLVNPHHDKEGASQKSS